MIIMLCMQKMNSLPLCTSLQQQAIMGDDKSIGGFDLCAKMNFFYHWGKKSKMLF